MCRLVIPFRFYLWDIPCPVVEIHCSGVGSAQLFRSTEGGSNPGEGWEPPNVPQPPFLFWWGVVRCEHT